MPDLPGACYTPGKNTSVPRNDIYLESNFLDKYHFEIDKSDGCNVTLGEPAYTIDTAAHGSNYTITFEAGRAGSEDVAKWFIKKKHALKYVNACNKEDWHDPNPTDLNFAFCGHFVPNDDGTHDEPIRVCFAQGNRTARFGLFPIHQNNWWVASDKLTAGCIADDSPWYTNTTGNKFLLKLK